MADLRITDLVSPEAMQQLKDLKGELQDLKGDYANTAREIAKGLTLNVNVQGDLDKLNNLFTGKAKEAEEQTRKMNDTLREQAAVIEKLQKALQARNATEQQTTNTISRELAEVEKLNAQKREEFVEDSKWKKLADDVLGTREQNLIRLAKTEKELKAVAEATKSLSKQEQMGQISSDDYAKKRAALLEQERMLKISKGELQQTLSNEEKMLQSSEGSYQRLSLELERMKKAYKQLSEEEKAAPQGQALASSIQNYDARLKDLAADMGEFQRNVGNYAIAGTSMRTQMRQMIEELANLEIQWRKMSAQEQQSAEGQEMKVHMDELRAKASELQDTIDDVRQDVKNGASDTAVFSGVTQGLNVMVSSIGAVKGATQLLGIEDENLVKVQTQLQSVLVVSNSLTQIQNAVQKQSFLMKGVATIQTKALTAAEELETAAKGKGVVATVALTAAQRVCNAVAKANPYVLLATVILGVVGAVIGLTKANKEEAASEEEATKAVERRRQAQEDFAKTVGQSAGAQIDKLYQLKRSWEALGKSVEEKRKFVEATEKTFQSLGLSVKSVADAENVLEKNTPKIVAALIARAQAAAMQDAITNEYKTMVEDIVKNEQATKKNVTANVGDTLNPAEAERLRNAGGRVNTTYKTVGGSNVSNGTTIEGYEVADKESAAILGRLRNLDQWNKRLQEKNRIISQSTQRIKGMTNAIDDLNKIADENLKGAGVKEYIGGTSGTSGGTTTRTSTDAKKIAFKSEEELQSELLKLHTESIQNKLQVTKKGTIEELDLRKELAQSEYDLSISENKKAEIKKLADVKISYEQGAITKEKYDEMVASITAEYADKETSLLAKKDADIEEAESAHAEALADIIARGYAQQQKAIDDEYANEMNKLEMNYAKRLITDEQYEEQKIDLDNKYAKDTAQNTIDSLNEQLKVANLSADEREQITEQLAQAEKEIAKAEADAEIEQIKRVTKEDDEARKKRIANAKKWLEKASQAISAIGDLVSSVYDGQLDKMDEVKDANSEAYDADVQRTEDLVEQNVITEEEGEARKRAAKDRTEAKDAELEKKKAALQYKQAVFNKAVQLAQTGISTARAIMEAAPSIPMMALMAAMGAIQTATIIATPIPKYAKGTGADGHGGGLAIVGDGGKSELVTFGGKSWITPDTPTLVDMPKGAMVYADADKAVNDLSVFPLARVSDSPNVVVNNDYSRLEKGVSNVCKLISKQMRQQHEIDYMRKYDNYRGSRL